MNAKISSGDFKNRQFRVLIGTDIIARGIDIQGIDLVINFEVPYSTDDYVHRVGRTARADSDGYAFTFVGEREQQSFYAIERALGIEVTRFDLPPYLGEPPAIQEPRARGGGGERRNFKGGGKRKSSSQRGPRNAKK
ncbi:MAG: DEAD/DEAH box helicase [Microscillaceae bacterium]|nr:DEAD/DEAH box helicase [Microscillaceae bacterium]